MSILSDLNKIKEEVFVFAFLDLFFLIAPGGLVLFYFRNDLFVELEILKLILLAVSIALPFVVINMFLALIFTTGVGATGNASEDLFLGLTMALFITNFIFYIILFFSYILDFNFKTAFWGILILELLIFLFWLVLIWLDKRFNKK